MAEIVMLIGTLIAMYIVVRMGDLLASPMPVGKLLYFTQVGVRLTALVVFVYSGITLVMLFNGLAAGLKQ